MRKRRLWSHCPKPAVMIAAALLAGATTASQAAVNPETTRAIFNASEQRIALSLANSAERPALVQLWLDDGDIMAPPEQANAPVAVLPPVFRMMPGEIRSVQMVRGNTRSLPRDREALFWLNIYQVPPMTPREQEAQNKLVVPLRVRMKLFIRPEGIDPPADAGWQSLTFTRQQAGNDGPRLAITNPTPWYITLAGIQCGQQHTADVMVAPKSTVNTEIPAAACQQIRYQVIDDQGNQRPFVSALRG